MPSNFLKLRIAQMQRLLDRKVTKYEAVQVRKQSRTKSRPPA
jgi:hypothetical protein